MSTLASRRPGYLITVLVLVTGWIASSQGAWSATLWSTGYGTDSATCGAQSKPCRSISQAIENASAGDTIYVGAGRYGDLGGDGTFSAPGSEHPQPYTNVNFVDIVECIICVNKPVSILAVHGPALTIIDGTNSNTDCCNFVAIVMVFSDGVTFGAVGEGFTVTSTSPAGNNTNFGVAIDGTSLRLNHVTVAGNTDLHDGTGFAFLGRNSNHFCPPFDCPPAFYSGTVFLQGNHAIGNGTGFFLQTNVDLGPGPTLLQDNVAENAGTGFAVKTGIPFEGSHRGTSQVFRFEHNTASRCGVGFDALLSGDLQNNLAVGNAQVGFLVTTGGGTNFAHNSAIDNGGPGAIVLWAQDVAFNADPPPAVYNGLFASFSSNNFLGNDRNRPVLSLGWNGNNNPGPSAHCGVLNMGAAATLGFPVSLGFMPVVNLKAASNFWGSANGPAPTGSGDMAGGACDQLGGATTFKPFATTTFGITPVQ